MRNYPDKVIEQIVTKYDELLSEQEILDKLRREAGWRMRNAVISHVNSGYNQGEKVLEKAKICEDSIQRCNKNIQITINTKKQINSLNRYQKYKEMLTEYNTLISKSVKSEDYKLADILKKWRDRLKSSTGVV